MSIDQLSRALVLGLCALLAAGVAGMAAMAPIASSGYRPAPGAWHERARTMLDAKVYHLAHAWAAVEEGDGPAAVAAAEASLKFGPRNARAWLALAWGRALSDDEQGAVAALERSYELAEKFMPLALSRAALAQRFWPRLGPEARRRLLEEVRIARGMDPHRFNQLAEEAPRLAVLHQLGEEALR